MGVQERLDDLSVAYEDLPDYQLGKRSLRELEGVHPKLVAVVKRAIQLTTVDFGVHDGLRTFKEQRQLVAKGASKTMNSKHLPQSDGYGHAVDLVPFVNGRLRWEWDLIWPIALAMDHAATELQVTIVWGAIWDRTMMQYGGSIYNLQEAVEQYKIRHKGRDFLDGPHYQLSSDYR